MTATILGPTIGGSDVNLAVTRFDIDQGMHAASVASCSPNEGGDAMTDGEVMYLSLVCGAVLIFFVALAYGSSTAIKRRN